VPVPTDIGDLSATASLNSPSGSDQRSQADDYHRAHASFIAQLRNKSDGFINVRTYGAVGDGVADDTEAFEDWATAINTAGGGQALIPPGTYKVDISSVLCAFSNLDGLTIHAGGVVIDDTTAYSTSEATLFRFTACKNVHVPRGMLIESERQSYSTFDGLIGFQLLQGCYGFDVDFSMDGGQIGFQCKKASGDSATYKSSQIKVRIHADHVHYPYNGQFSGENVDVDIEAISCGRNFFIYGVSHNRINVRSVDQQVTSLIKAYSGYGCDTVDVKYTDRTSTSCVAAAPVMAVEFGDSTAAAHRNIKINVNLKNPSGAPWSNAVSFNKYSDGGTTPDSTGRGHVLDGFILSGISDNTGVSEPHVDQGQGAFASADVIRNFSIENFTGLGTSANIQPEFPPFVGQSVWKNVTCESNINTGTGTGGKVVFVGCKAKNFTTATNVTDTHDYIGCEITDGTLQNVADNKCFVNTKVVSSVKSATSGSSKAATWKTGVVMLRSVKTLSGDLTGTNNIFLIAPALATGAYFRLKYFLVADAADLSVATRDETSGTKSFSATMNGSGTWEAQLAVANDVTERTQGTASVITVSLVNGSSAGAHIAVACTNYNASGSRGYFELEMICMSTADIELTAA
jgi:hypothetical protein